MRRFAQRSGGVAAPSRLCAASPSWLPVSGRKTRAFCAAAAGLQNAHHYPNPSRSPQRPQARFQHARGRAAAVGWIRRAAPWMGRLPRRSPTAGQDGSRRTTQPKKISPRQRRRPANRPRRDAGAPPPHHPRPTTSRPRKLQTSIMGYNPKPLQRFFYVRNPYPPPKKMQYIRPTELSMRQTTVLRIVPRLRARARRPAEREKIAVQL